MFFSAILRIAKHGHADSRLQLESILREINIDKNIEKLNGKIYATGIVPAGNRLKLVQFPSIGVVYRCQVYCSKKIDYCLLHREQFYYSVVW
jgi:hypothetical protein